MSRSIPGSHAERGSAAVEFVLVGTLLTLITAAVLQMGVALYVRNIVHDAAIDGAYRAALIDASPDDAEQAVRQVTSSTMGADIVHAVTVSDAVVDGDPVVEVTVSAVLPLLGLLGPSAAMEVTARAPRESFDVN